MEKLSLEKDYSNQSLLGKYFDLLNQFYPNKYTLYRGQSRLTYEPTGDEHLEPLPSLLRNGERTPMNYLNTMEGSYLKDKLGLTEHDIPDWASLNSNDLISLEKKFSISF